MLAFDTWKRLGNFEMEPEPKLLPVSLLVYNLLFLEQAFESYSYSVFHHPWEGSR